ncbi:bacterial peptide chain release factor 1 (bRF-1) [Tindallia magadiensis]|uniref:Peptide chain release factor 1 n=1 Tax=Tindallia magadiensis TaxID=69895 RepID=A0A1I3C2X8_9FIRM|nr:peptide chain release factor 1 [Tindallia magadiensis]SFH68907.1 bacterial peptide chain release factor 1 (bRF-1) [Tindallia magadiensis]
MLEKLSFLEDKYEDLGKKLSDPEVINQQDLWRKLVKEHAELEEIVVVYRDYRETLQGLEDTKAILYDKSSEEELKEMARMELGELEEKEETLREKLRIMLLPKDPNDDKNVIVEVRAGTGGDEAGLFAADLFRMYSRFAEDQGWKVELMSASESGVGGYKEVVFMIKGKGAYSMMKFESGTHRVQRIPTTESGGRIHTSAATVAVLPEVDDVELEISPNDVRIDVFRASGHGGQSVNTTDSAVRITHLETGIVSSCQDEKSQLKNKDKAMKILKARLYDKMAQEQADEIAQNRRSQVGSGDRSERIRTYNYPQGRVTDHRINMTIYQLDSFMQGDIGQMINALITEDQAEQMKEMA